MTDDMREELTECSVIFHSSNLSDFQQKVNAAAAEIALKGQKRQPWYSVGQSTREGILQGL